MLVVELPRLIKPFTILRNEKKTINNQHYPTNDLEAFSINLPESKLLRFLFYRNAHLLISTTSNIKVDDSSLESNNYLDFLKSKNTKIHAAWRTIPQEPTQLTLKFTQGAQESFIYLNYPCGINGEKEG